MSTDNVIKEQGLSSIGLEVKIGTTKLEYAQKIGDIGAEADQISTTCFKNTVETSIPGVKKLGVWTVDFLFDNSAADSDYRKVKALENAGNAVALEVKFPDGTIFKNSGKVTVKVTGPGTNEAIKATASVYLQGDWEVTDPAAS